MPKDSEAHSNATRRRSVSRRDFVVATGVTGISSLAGCYSDDGGTGQDAKTIQYMGSSDAGEFSQEINDALHKGGLSKDIKVDIVSGSIPDKRKARYQQWLSGNRSKPDLLNMDSGWTIPFITRGQLVNLSEELPQDALDTINNDYFDMVTKTAKGANGDLYAVPLWADFPTVQYRKDLVEKAGYNPESKNWATEPMSWKRFSEIVKDVQEQQDVQYGVTHQMFQGEGLSCCTFNEFLHSWGGSYFGPTDNLMGPVGDRPITVDEQPVIDSIRMARTLLYGQDDEHALEGFKQVISTDALEWHPGLSNKPFMDGKAVAQRNWPFVIPEAGSKDNFGEDLGVMPIPYGVPESKAKYDGTGGSICALGGWHVGLNPNSEKKDAALEVLAAMTSDAVQLKLFELNGRIPPNPKLFKSDRAQQLEPIGRYLDTLHYAGQNTLPRPVTVAWPDQSTQIVDKVHKAYSRDMAPEPAMSQLKDDLAQIEGSFE